MVENASPQNKMKSYKSQISQSDFTHQLTQKKHIESNHTFIFTDSVDSMLENDINNEIVKAVHWKKSSLWELYN